MIRQALFYIVVFITAAFLLVVSFNSKNRNFAVIAEVEPQKTAISFPKPVRIKQVHVAAGEHVQKGDLLLEVERPDLELDIQKIRNEISQVNAERAKRREDYQAISRVSALRHRQQIAALNAKLQEIEGKFKADSLFFVEVTSWTGSDSLADNNQYYLARKSLIEEKTLEERQFASEQTREKTLFEKDMEFYELRRQRLADELQSHLVEKESLKQYSPINGTIGSVSVQLMELIPPYETIISVYDENPNVIKAYMNEQATIPIEVGNKVQVESINREYAITGEIVEIGSRIVSYPAQMTPTTQMQMWGKEIFVQIPESNEFLNGEKVYVYLDAK